MDKHIPVLKKEVIGSLNIKPNGIYVDCTAGRGGHVEAIMKAEPKVTVVAIDKDPVNTEFLSERFKENKVLVANTDYKSLDDVLAFYNIDKVDGILLDLGFSSIHVDDAERGFSFSKKGPLDMRYNRTQELTAELVINDYTQEELIRVIKEYGEEPFYYRIVQAILAGRLEKRIQTTFELRDIIKNVVPSKGWGPKKIDPATKTFQALRIEVNSELESLKVVLEKSISLLKKDGRLCVITFHSLEDRMVKIKFNDEARTCICPKGLVQCICDYKPRLKVITKKAIVPDDKEMGLNPRSRSAKLRVAQKL